MSTQRELCVINIYCMAGMSLAQVIYHRQSNVKPGNEFLRTQPYQVICNCSQKSPQHWSCEISWFKKCHGTGWWKLITELKVIDYLRWLGAGSMNRNWPLIGWEWSCDLDTGLWLGAGSMNRNQNIDLSWGEVRDRPVVCAGQHYTITEKSAPSPTFPRTSRLHHRSEQE